MEGLMVAVNAIGFPEDSPFRKVDQVLVLEDLTVEVRNKE